VFVPRTPNINVVFEIRDPDNWQLYPDKYEVLDLALIERQSSSIHACCCQEVLVKEVHLAWYRKGGD
jgi:hypothetical protein